MNPFQLPPGLVPFSVQSGLAGRLKSAIGGGLGVGFAAWVSLWLSHQVHASAWLVAPLGASTVLVFAAPASSFARPLTVVAGNTISALSGIIVVHLVHDPVLAVSLAVGLAIAAMSILGCLHPPGGGVALLCVLLQVGDPLFAFFPTAVNSALLVFAAWTFNTLFNPLRTPAVPLTENLPD